MTEKQVLASSYPQSTATFSFSYHQQSSSFSVSRNEYWYAVPTCSWIRINNNSGYGYRQVYFDMTANLDYEPRTAQILITGSRGIISCYTVTQDGFVESMKLDSTTLNEKYGSINADGSFQGVKDSLSFTTNFKWSATCSSWIKLEKTSGESANKGTSISFTVDPNTTGTTREGVIRHFMRLSFL